MINTRNWLTGGQFIHTADKNCMVNLLHTKSHLNEYILKRKDSKFYWQTRKSTKHTRYFRKEEKWKCSRKIFSSLPFRKVKEIPRTNCIQVLDLFTLSHKINLWAGPLKLSLSEKCTQCITGMHQHHYLFKPHTKYIIFSI